jgi:alpha-amylase
LGVLLQGFFFGPHKVHGVPSPLDGDKATPFWWDHLASQAALLRAAGFTAVWLPPPLKGASGGFSNGYDLFDDYDLGSKEQKGTVATRYGTRELLARCVALLRANGLDVYLDLVENQRDGDDGHFNFRYVDAFGRPGGGRFGKGPGDFHPHVPQDPGVFTDAFEFGRDLAPLNSVGHHALDGLLASADWLTRAIDVQGFRLDNTKGVSTEFVVRLLDHASLRGKFAVGEFADGDVGLLQGWADATRHRASSFDFPLHFMLKHMCNSPGDFDMASLDHAGLTGVDPLGSVTFVENHDTDRGGIGGPIVRNKMLAYAYILTAEGYPCVFYRDYSRDQDCFGLKEKIDRLIWVHERLAAGPTVQRWKDAGVFAFERLGGGHLLVGLNKDVNAPRTIKVQTGFPPHTQLKDFAGHAGAVKTDGAAAVTLTIPSNDGGLGYVCYAPPAPGESFHVSRTATSQDYEGAVDLDIKPAVEGESVRACRVFVEAHTELSAGLTSFDTRGWTQDTSIEFEIRGPGGQHVAGRTYGRDTAPGASVQLQTDSRGWFTLSVRAANTPPENKTPGYRLNVKYTAPQTLP